MKMLLPTRLLLLLSCTLMLFSCKKEKEDMKENTFYGPQVHIGEGKARSFITISHLGVPQEIGIEMTKEALNGLSNNPMDFEHNVINLPLHQKAMGVTPFDHLTIDWNPQGHPAQEIFGVPHFDFHFYTISVEEQMAIPPYVPNGPHDVFPPPQFRPAGYAPLPGGVPRMGKHWGDVVNPVAPGNFTHTMIWGSFNGKFIFVEPMVTRAFLLTGQSVSMPFGQPAQYQQTKTYYPTKYNIYRSDKKDKIYITLSAFVKS